MSPMKISLSVLHDPLIIIAQKGTEVDVCFPYCFFLLPLAFPFHLRYPDSNRKGERTKWKTPEKNLQKPFL